VLEDGRIQCDVCPRYCKLHEGQRGLCFVRARQGDQVVLTTYGRSSGFCIDPIEKKPLNHGAGRDVVGIWRGAISGNMKVSFQAARSIG
jgi:hypothetical protein